MLNISKLIHRPTIQNSRVIGGEEFEGKRAFRNRNPIAEGLSDYLPFKLYDTLVGAAGAATLAEYQFFTVPQSAAKSKNLTNLEQAGRLPDPRKFFVRSLRFCFSPDMVLADIQNFLNNYYLEFWIGGKIYMEGPIMLFPGGTGVAGVSTAAAINTYSNGLPAPQYVDDYGEKGITILQGQTFKVKAIADTGGTFNLANAPAPGLRMTCVLDGMISREVQ